MFKELDYKETPMGELVLRRRSEPKLGGEVVYEVKLGDDFLMSSLFTEGEIALARLGLSGLTEQPLDIVVGGLGLGYTAATALQYPMLRSMLVIETMPEVIDWHRRGLVPMGKALTEDPRCRFIQGDFFNMAGMDGAGFDPDTPGRRFHAVLLDIDHAPDHVLHPDHAGFYEPAGLRRLTRWLHTDGVFALWSNNPPDEAFLRRLGESFARVSAEIVQFPNPYTGEESSNTIYVARTK
ncbi:MAG: spermidine synthase [Gammaproteobacteria bacterium]